MQGIRRHPTNPVPFLLFLVIFVSLPLRTFADCAEDGQRAMDLCESKIPIDEMNQGAQDIIRNFNPANGRMSPETCLGLEDGYKKFKNLTQKYIDACGKQRQDAYDNCNREIQSKGFVSTKSYNQYLQAKKEKSKLKQYLLPMDALAARLEDCLRDIRGRSNVNTNTDRGDATSEGKVSTSGSNPGGDNSSSAEFSNQSHSTSQGNTSTRHGTLGTGGVDATGNSGASKPNKKNKVDSAAPWARHYQASSFAKGPGNASANNSADSVISRAIADSASQSNKELGALQVEILRRIKRGPASAGYDLGIAGPHSNVFANIRKRYQQVHSRKELFLY